MRIQHRASEAPGRPQVRCGERTHETDERTSGAVLGSHLLAPSATQLVQSTLALRGSVECGECSPLYIIGTALGYGVAPSSERKWWITQ